MTADAAKIVIAHRGASGYLPEHTLEAYTLAFGMGADYIEPDLVRTKDGAFISLHDIHLEGTTDVEQRFPDRAREDGRWYAADFTLAEIKTLKCHERLKNRFPEGKSSFEVPTFEEVIELVQGLNQVTGRNVGIYPELKQPSFHNREGLPMEKAFLDIVTRYGYEGPHAKIFVQCFEHKTLQALRTEFGCTLPQIALISDSPIFAKALSDEGLAEIATYAQGIGPSKSIIEKDPELVRRAHDLSLLVHPYTVRCDQVPGKYTNTQEELGTLYFRYDVDGLFTDCPDDAVRILATERSVD
jgi:glycerophosphoryl diester phosphodiesterase